MTYNNQAHNTTLISYYDEIEDFKYNPQTQQISWSMPFDWNTTRIKGQDILVHEEIKLPKSFEEFGPKASFKATVNDHPLVNRALVVDPFTSNNATTIHYVIDKNQILELAGNLTKPGISFMSFTLSSQAENASQSP